ncbi:hypothetical protein [Streptomyces sp. NPDC088146]|uniref:hypothetical protein n=1 Tax=Streptomyces sp. NPDC088146 TaxID=3365829 RepID=UPI0038079A41
MGSLFENSPDGARCRSREKRADGGIEFLPFAKPLSVLLSRHSDLFSEILRSTIGAHALKCLSGRGGSRIGRQFVVNNAGAYPRRPWEETDERAWASALDVNLTIHYRASRAVTSAMVRR